ncbi:MAG: hypothetical protein ABEI86_03775 [Halobacteriaceae archaeon]
MVIDDSQKKYRLKLREGDFIRASIKSVGTDSAKVDTTRWANVEQAILTEVSESASISPGTNIFATVSEIESGSAKIKQKRGVYRRKTLPGDTIRVQGKSQISSTLVQTDASDFSNLESLYVVGISAGADAEAQLVKIRKGAGIAIPTKILDPGLVSGREVIIETSAGSKEALVSRVVGQKSIIQDKDWDVPLELIEPAPVSCLANGEISNITDNGITAEIEDYPKLPDPGETIKTRVRQKHSETMSQVGENDAEIKVEFEHGFPITGTAQIKLNGISSGTYRGELINYTYPELKLGDSYKALIYESKNLAKVKKTNKQIPVKLREDVQKNGEAFVELIEIGGSLVGRIDGEVKQVLSNNSSSENVDMTNLSKL